MSLMAKEDLDAIKQACEIIEKHGGKVAVLYTIEDITCFREDLTREQAMEVMEAYDWDGAMYGTFKHFDPVIEGRDSLIDLASKMFPEKEEEEPEEPGEQLPI